MLGLVLLQAAPIAETASKGLTDPEAIGSLIGGAVVTILTAYAAIKGKSTESKTNDQTKLITETLVLVGGIKKDVEDIREVTKDVPGKIAVLESGVTDVKESIRKHGERIGALESKLKIEQKH
jgi:peptidoglycan hydrolase CwlO-like protein